MKYYKQYFLSTLCLLTIIIISVIFSTTVFANLEPEGKDEINSLKFDRQLSVDHILYRLQIIDITTKNMSKFNLSRLEYAAEESEREINLINREELMQIFGSEFELELEKVYEQEKEELILGPRILVAPGYPASMYVAQEDLFLDAEYTELETYTNTFELEVFPEGGFDEDNNLFTAVNLRTGEGTTGLETDLWIRAHQPHLLAVMESSKKEEIKSLNGKNSAKEKRYFALYLTARPVGVLTLPDLSTSLAGLEKIFNDSELAKNESGIILKLAYDENSDNNYGISLTGFYQNDFSLGLDFKINEILTNRNTAAVMGNFYDNLWLGAELIYTEAEELELALKLKDMVEIGSLQLSASINPLSYNFDSENNYLTWYLRGETVLQQKLQFALEYKSLSDYDFAEVNLEYHINNKSILLGYTWNLDIEEEEAYWIGFQYKF
ncbi:MAG: hypothetical protein ACLFSO_07160 [Halanaerobium sp.]